MPHNIVNRKLKAARAEKAYTQRDMAEKLDMSIYSFIKKENGDSQFRESEINKILNIFDRKYEDIFMP